MRYIHSEGRNETAYVIYNNVRSGFFILGKRNEKKMEKSVDKRGKRRYTNQAVPRGTVRIGKTGQELRKNFLTKGFGSDRIIKLHFAGRQRNQRFSVESERNLEKSS